MRHSSRSKHLKHVHRSAHIRRMSYFRTVQSAKLHTPSEKSNLEDSIQPLQDTSETTDTHLKVG